MPLGYLVLLSNQEIVDITSPALTSMEAAVGLHLCFVCWDSEWRMYVSLPEEVAQPSGRESGERATWQMDLNAPELCFSEFDVLCTLDVKRSQRGQAGPALCPPSATVAPPLPE